MLSRGEHQIIAFILGPHKIAEIFHFILLLPQTGGWADICSALGTESLRTLYSDWANLQMSGLSYLHLRAVYTNALELSLG